MQQRSEMQQRQGYQAVEKLRETLDEKYLWEVILLYAGESFKTYTGLPFTYEVRKGRNGDYTRELWIDRRENSKSLALSSVLLALRNIKKVGAVVDRPKALGDIRGVSELYLWNVLPLWADRCAGYSQAEDEVHRIYFLGGKRLKRLIFSLIVWILQNRKI